MDASPYAVTAFIKYYLKTKLSRCMWFVNRKSIFLRLICKTARPAIPAGDGLPLCY
ncbi:hypothetical protein CLOSTASPAR_01677 [[Clostridium] asparagiforme DSM 15981]|uniref:Uncharacterized protein n=1 Tax=[Clostridium] asparagiforme DSM 15981 TaxID=518636 RepID=C0CXF5_9FIRM|nr:hypothetical protein CLOSTASPAR_01677 [[Clostridium] asparagiforme DSM 15981]